MVKYKKWRRYIYMKAKITVNKDFKIGEIDKRIYGSFIEHIGRSVYEGVCEPEHETSDDMGFRRDVIDMVKSIDVPIVRYPGGNFVSGYRWTDGVGDKSKRPKRLDLAWKSIETNQIGIDEFQEWARRANTEVMMAVNLGLGTPSDAQNLLEYCNLETDTKYANMRRENGFEKPFGIKTWCLGNEMDGRWQIGSKTAEEYGRIANETAKVMKWTDPTVELVVCGSSNYNMPTFGQWELTVLDHTYDNVDYISLHQYYGNRRNNTPDFLGRPIHMDAFIKSVAAICDAIKAKKHSQKTVNLSFDEWNVWYQNAPTTPKDWQEAPPILEEVYTFEDALVVGGLLITLQNNCDRVKMACLAQLINVIAPIMTVKGGKTWAQTIYYPYMYSSVCGRGTTLRSMVDCESYTTTDRFEVPFISASVINNEEKRELVVFAVNRYLEDDIDLDLDLQGFEGATLQKHIELYSDDLKQTNSAGAEAVSPTEKAIADKVTLTKHSWNMLVYKY